MLKKMKPRVISRRLLIEVALHVISGPSGHRWSPAGQLLEKQHIAGADNMVVDVCSGVGNCPILGILDITL